MLGRRQGAPRWVDDPVRRRDGKFQRTGQEANSPSERSITAGGADKGGGNNSYIIISYRV